MLIQEYKNISIVTIQGQEHFFFIKKLTSNLFIFRNETNHNLKLIFELPPEVIEKKKHEKKKIYIANSLIPGEMSPMTSEEEDEENKKNEENNGVNLI